MLITMAWRNIWRNARRSIITMTAMAAGVAGIVSLYSYREAANEMIIRDVTSGLLGHLQVHGLGYQEAPGIATVVKNPVQVEAALHGALPGAKAERRVIGAGLAGSGDRSAPVTVLGLEPDSSTMYRLDSGRNAAKGEVLIGRELALDLQVKNGGELVLVSQGADGSVANDRYTVSGTFTSSSSELDANAVVMPLAEAQSFFALGDGVHQVVVKLPTDQEDVSAEVNTLRAALDLKTLEALSWSEMLPQMKASIDQKRKNAGFMDFVIFLIVGLGVFNAMTMSVFERTHELGVLAALGTRPRRILGMVLFEALWQAALAFAAGVLIASAILYGIGTADLSSMMKGDVMGVRMPSHLELSLFPGSLKGAAITAFFTAVVGALLPAFRAARLKPVEALRHT
ncbi:MAG: ABC transporter permease [Archangium sp.]|nr:ABC transporter permease [Archangium sp.]